MEPRPLQVWEQVFSVMNVSLAVELEGALKPLQIQEAVETARQEYPYLRCVLKVVGERLCFVEGPSEPVCLQQSVDDNQDWQSHLVAIGNKPRDHSQGVVYLELHSTHDQARHVLTAVFNHAGTDGLGIFNMLDTIFTHLGNLAGGLSPVKRQPRQMVDILARIPDSVATDPKPDIPAAFMPSLVAVPEHLRPSDKAYAGGLWNDWTEEQTAILIRKCKEQGVTVQAAVTAATMIGMAAANASGYPLPQTVLVQAPANMRQEVEPPVDADENACGASFLWWPQPLAAEDTLWSVAAKASENIKKETAARSGLAFWKRVQTQGWAPPYTITSSSIGVNPIKGQYGPIKVGSVHMLMGNYGAVDPNDAVVMTHVHTIDGRLSTSMTYSMPATGQDRANTMASVQERVLKALVEGSGGATVGEFL